jgi:hypothetical protein
LEGCSTAPARLGRALGWGCHDTFAVTEPPIRVLIADEHRLVRGGLTTVAGCKEGVEVMGAASAGVEAVELVRGEEPDP